MKIKSYSQFKKDVEKSTEFNAQVGFWIGFVYLLYSKGKISYDQALTYVVGMGKYNGV